MNVHATTQTCKLILIKCYITEMILYLLYKHHLLYFAWVDQRVQHFYIYITTILCQVGSYRTVVAWVIIEC